MQTAHDAQQRLQRRPQRRAPLDRAGRRRSPRTRQMMIDLALRQRGLLAHQRRQRAVPRAAALARMLKGVLTACARLPACVRARWTMSALTASTRLKSSTKGWISLGKRPSIGVTPPARCDASCARNRASGRSPTSTCTTAAAVRPAASAPSAISSMWLKRPTGSASAAVSAATASRSAPDSDSSGLSVRVSVVSRCRSGPAMS